MRTPILLAAAIAVAAPLPAMAADWYRMVQLEGRTGYIDADSIRQDGQWTLIQILTISDEVTENGAKSVRAELQIDCEANMLRIARFAMFGPDRAQIDELEWPDKGALHDTGNRTPFAAFTAFACNAHRPGGVQVGDPYTDTP